MACQSPLTGHCHPPCQRIRAASCSPPAPADHHQRHEERPLHEPPTVIPIPGAAAGSGLWERCFSLLGAHMSRTTLQAARGGIHMHICIAPRLTALSEH